MKKLFTLSCVLMFGSLYGQITITNADLPSANDTARISRADANTPVDLTLTGANYTWDFSFLTPVSQDVDSFISVFSTPLVYSFVFGFNSNLVQRGVDVAAFPGAPISDVYGFYNKSSNNFKQTGYGASINGQSVPVDFNSDDIIYDFPVNFGNIDSSDSDYSLIIPNLAAAVGNQRRVNVVDGWGNVTTPYGTFSALRIVSTLTGEDSLYLDTLGQGFSAQRPLTREYKWMANGQDIPVLQINTVDNFGNENVTAIIYRDSVRVLSSLMNIPAPVALNLYPNPVKDAMVVASIKVEKMGQATIDILSYDGRLISRSTEWLMPGTQTLAVRGADQRLDAGVYLVRISFAGQQFVGRLMVQH